MKSTRERRDEIRQLIASQPVATQAQLRALLVDRGYAVTQATLSRDLAQLRARRAPLPAGGTLYELPDAPNPAPLLADLIRSIDDNGTLVIIRTTSGAAQVVASAIDRAQLVEAAGTIAGDDTIFLAPARSVPAARLAKRVREIIKQPR
ncbi:MAG: Arginine pathway regulatory protein ArgR, repressor of arg regulon [Myxococcales bacterium]|nr:Arginine pathway regulatory protein ArgR, repressor of arg regulon [Myxococcales bacterium]